MNDWNLGGRLEDVLPLFESYRFDWLDAAEMIRNSDILLQYPMVDKDPIDTWTFGRITLAGDAAHPMYPRGSNGAAQAAIDARVLADCLAASGNDVRKALSDYEAQRAGPAAKVVRTNREFPPDFINIKVEELVGDRAVRQPRRLHHARGIAAALRKLQEGRRLHAERRRLGAKMNAGS